MLRRRTYHLFAPRRARRHAACCSLVVEHLEDRTLLAGEGLGQPILDPTLLPAVSAVTVRDEIVPGGFMIRTGVPASGSNLQHTSSGTTFVGPLPAGGAGSSTTLVDSGGSGGSSPASPLNIELLVGPGLAGNASALAAFERAASYFESVLFDPITIRIDAELTTVGFDANTLGEASSQQLNFLYSDIRARLIDDASDDESLVESLPDADGQLTFNLASEISTRSLSNDTVIQVNRANALALGFTDLPGDSSQYGGGFTIDGTIKFNAAFSFDYDSSNGVTGGRYDFEAIAMHEIGHILGFISSVDDVDQLVADGENGSVDPSVMDLFRLTPGQGANFSTAPRVLNTGTAAPIQVFYDGRFNPSAYAGVINGLGTGDIPMATGAEEGDGHQASHFKDNAGTGVYLGVMDPTFAANTVGVVTTNDLRVFGLIGWDWHDTSKFGTVPQVAIDLLETTNDQPALGGTVSEADADVLVSIPAALGTNNVTLTVSGNPRDADTWQLANEATSSARIARIEFLLPDNGIQGSNPTGVSPFFNTSGSRGQEFLANASLATDVGLVVSPDVRDNSKTFALDFTDFDPGEELRWRLGVNTSQNVSASFLAVGRLVVYFDNGTSATGVLINLGGNTVRLQLESNHAVRATNHGDGTWSLPAGSFAPLAPDTYDVTTTVIDRTGAVAIDDTSGELVVFEPGSNNLVLGNLVWDDADGDAVLDPGESGIAGVAVNLYRDTDTSGDWTPGVDVFVASQTTDENGLYEFANLLPGDYLVQIDPGNFETGGPLAGRLSSTRNAPTPDPDDNVDDDDNGTPLAGQGVLSRAITLSAGEEPNGEGAASGLVNWTLDFGFYTPAGSDFGDAPASYGTEGAGAAAHFVLAGFYLGAGVSLESAGQSDPLAEADDQDDGVQFASALQSGMSVQVDVTASLSGRLDAWIDYNGDGDFDDPGEQVFDSIPLAAGLNQLAIDVPIGATPTGSSRTFARFRLSSAGGLAPTGSADDGEVEDYALSIVAGELPKVVAVTVDSTAWTAAFRQQFADGVYLVPAGSGQLDTLPYSGLDRVSIRFSKDVVVAAGDLRIVGVNVPEQSLAGFSYDSQTWTATWTLSAGLRPDKVLLDLAATVADTEGNPLDGNWTNGAGGAFPSGNDQVDSDDRFLFRINVLPGDATGDAVVDRLDLAAIVAGLGATYTSPKYVIRSDVNGDGRISMTDLRDALRGFQGSLPAAEPDSPTLSEPLTPTDAVFDRIGGGSGGSSQAATTSLSVASTADSSQDGVAPISAELFDPLARRPRRPSRVSSQAVELLFGDEVLGPA